MKRFLPYNPKLKQRAKKMRKNMTFSEQKIRFYYLKNLDFRVLKQRPIGNFIVDFYIPEKMIVIEIDGEIHTSEKATSYDQERSKMLEGYGIKIIRISNNEILNHFPYVCSKLNNLIN